jgi:hypothetical protein
LIDKNNTAGQVRADIAYRSQANEKIPAARPLRSQIHRKKRRGQADVRANARKSAGALVVEYVFARQKGPMGLFAASSASPERKPRLAGPIAYKHAADGLAHQPGRTSLSHNAACRGAPTPLADPRDHPLAAPVITRFVLSGKIRIWTSPAGRHLSLGVDGQG